MDSRVQRYLEVLVSSYLSYPELSKEQREYERLLSGSKRGGKRS